MLCVGGVVDGLGECGPVGNVEWCRVIVVPVFHIHDYDMSRYINYTFFDSMNQHWKNVRTNQVNNSSSKSTYAFSK